jgi:uncharacterized protein YcbX
VFHHEKELASGSLRTLARWPVKSLGGEFLDRADVDHWGISGDRRYTVADAAQESSYETTWTVSNTFLARC